MDFLLKEDGDYLLQENDDKIILEVAALVNALVNIYTLGLNYAIYTMPENYAIYTLEGQS